ncbi:MAG: penicillin-binding protein 2 [Chloroflexi bacterium]|nr:penicillin-binding protein 2 [Chloroflexota bacterium]
MPTLVRVRIPRTSVLLVAGSAVLLLLFDIACGGEQQPLPAVGTATPAPSPVRPSADEVAARFFRAWEQGQYEPMYALLSAAAQAATPRDTFLRRYTSIEQGVGTRRITVQAQPATADPVRAPSPSALPTAGSASVDSGAPGMRVPFQVTRTVTMFGDLVESNDLRLVEEPDGWRIDWQPGLIFRDLTAGGRVQVSGDVPKRGRILDRKGRPLAEEGPTALTVGVVPGQVADEPALVRALSETLALPPETVRQRLQGGQPDWFMPVADRPFTERAALSSAFGTLKGVVVRDQLGRVYPLGAAAAHLTGYVGRVTAEDLRRLASQGYEETDLVGRGGLEAWGEARLAGQRGGRIAIVDEQGSLVRTVAERPTLDGANLQLTLDVDIQARAYEVLGERTGSIVVLDPRDSSVLALVSRPSFDSNRFVAGLSDQEWQALNSGGQPLQFRAVGSAYPAASTFKVVTMAAGLERGVTRPSDTFDCGLEWRGLPGIVLRNWTAQPTLDLTEALTQSCNPAFYEIGQRLDRLDPAILPAFARAFGFGQPTGVQGVDEVAGLVPDPAWKQRERGQPWTTGDSVNLAIGQGDLLVTPLQLANAYAALANGGTLRTPRLVTRIGASPVPVPPERGRLPISATTRATILEGMRRVTSTLQGTASAAFRGATIPTAAKTGSAENGSPDAHAWFVGFRTPDAPTLLGLVMVEGGQMGGTTAAPIARELLDAASAVQP